LTEIYHVYDHDPMDGSYGKDYLAGTYASREAAEAEVDRRNEAWKAFWIATATDGAARVGETWNWKHARLVIGQLK
jgi:hypothetical protein